MCIRESKCGARKMLSELKRKKKPDWRRKREEDQKQGVNMNPVLNGDYLPPLQFWKEPKSGFDYGKLALKKSNLRYGEIAKLIPFLLGNGLEPSLMKEFLQARNLIDNDVDWGTVESWIKKFNRHGTDVFYLDVKGNSRAPVWRYANGNLRGGSLRQSQ